MFTAIQEHMRALMERWRGNRCSKTTVPRRQRLVLETLENRVVPASLAPLVAPHPPVVPAPIALSAPTVESQSATNAALLFNNSIATLWTPPVTLPPAPVTLLPYNYSVFGASNSSAQLSSLGVVDASQPLSVSSLSAQIKVRSASSATIPAQPYVPLTEPQSFFPVSADEEFPIAIDAG
jgi:hypothetical protein